MSPNAPSLEAAERTLAEARKRAAARGELTVSPPENPERRARRLQYLVANPNADELEAAAVIDEQMRQEDEQAAAGKEWVAGIVGSLERMWACSACGAGNGMGNPAGLCDACSAVARSLRAQRFGTDIVAGRSRLELVERFLDRTG
jgi:rubrerythrin